MERNEKLGSFLYHSSVSVLNREIRIQMYETQNGICIIIEGGDLGHIGAIAFSFPDTEAQSFTFPTHKETIICERWLERIRGIYGGPVIVIAGIHYNGITKEQIQNILAILDMELVKVINYLKVRDFAKTDGKD